MGIKLFWKDPDSIEDFTIDWSDHLGTDTIATSVWTVPAGLTESSSSNTATKATVTLSSGTVDAFYTVTNRITTAGGRTLDQSIHVRVRSK